MTKQRTIDERLHAVSQWCYANLPPVVTVLLLITAMPVVLLVVLVTPPKYTGLWRDDD